MIDLIVRGDERDIAVEDGVIARIAPEIGEPAREEVDARGLHVLPGAIDAHVHFNDPGRADWEGWATGTAALAAGGATACVEMPLNAHPPTVDGAAFDAKLARPPAARPWTLRYGAGSPGDLDRLDELAARGVVGFKAFMCDSGIDDFQAVDDDGLGAGMQRAAVLGSPSPSTPSARRGCGRRATGAGGSGPRRDRGRRAVSHRARARASRRKPAARCTSSTSRSPREPPRWPRRRRGVDATCETCPHYLVLRAADMERLGTLAKCAPPLRDDPDELWEQLEHVTLVGSDHSPCPPAMKAGEFDTAWGGIAGAQTTLPLLLGEGLRRGVPLARLADLVTGARPPLPPARQGAAWRSARTPTSRWCRSAASTPSASLHDRHRANPFAGRRLGARVVRTLLRGHSGGRPSARPPKRGT